MGPTIFFCPYCGEEDLEPVGDAGVWQCHSCTHTFTVSRDRQAGKAPAAKEVAPPASGTDGLLAAARDRLQRPEPAEAAARLAAGALLVDTRPEWQRRAEGEIPGALVIERNHLEWRLDPAGDARIPEAEGDPDVIVFCSAGYSSSLAAAALLDVGVARATDLAGGFQAWRDAGLPVTAGGTAPGRRTP